MREKKWGRCLVGDCQEEGIYCDVHGDKFAQSSYEDGLKQGKAATIQEIAEGAKKLERFYLNSEGRLEATPHGALVRFGDVWSLMGGKP